MADFKYELPLYTIDEDGDLKFRHSYLADIIPKIDETIVVLFSDENGNYVRRIYYKVKDVVHGTLASDDNKIIQRYTPILHCELQIDEPILK